MRPSALRQTSRIAALLAIGVLGACSDDDGAPPSGPGGDGGMGLPRGAPDRVMAAAPGGSFVAALPAPGGSAVAPPTGVAGPPWAVSFIGASAGSAPAAAAAVQASGRAFALFAGGRGVGIAALEDDFLFLHRTLAGDGAVVALLRSIEGCDDGRVSFGPMIRAGTDPRAGYVLGAASGRAGGTALQARNTAGVVAATLRLDSAVSLPLWLKVERQGLRVRSGYSSDGVRWVEADSVVSDLGAEVEVGLAATSHREVHCRGLFESVEVIGAGN